MTAEIGEIECACAVSDGAYRESIGRSDGKRQDCRGRCGPPGCTCCTRKLEIAVDEIRKSCAVPIGVVPHGHPVGGCARKQSGKVRSDYCGTRAKEIGVLNIGESRARCRQRLSGG